MPESEPELGLGGVFLYSSFVMLIPLVVLCCLLGWVFKAVSQCRIMCLGGSMVVRCFQARTGSSLGLENEDKPGSSHCSAPQRRKGCWKLYLRYQGGLVSCMMRLGIELNVLLGVSHKGLLVCLLFFKAYSISIACVYFLVGCQD